MSAYIKRVLKDERIASIINTEPSFFGHLDYRAGYRLARAIEAAVLATVPVINVLPKWIVNDLGELGVLVNGRFCFLYKGDNLEYGSITSTTLDGIVMHEDDTPMRYREVGKREFGEVCQPISRLRWNIDQVIANPVPPRHTEELEYHVGLSFGTKEGCAWRDLPAMWPLPDKQTTTNIADSDVAQKFYRAGLEHAAAYVEHHCVDGIDHAKAINFLPSPEVKS